MKTQESGEDYLETILTLQRRQGYVRSIDIATELEYTKPSISRAMKVLRENGYITMDENKLIQLTDKGQRRAEEIYGRHKLITRYLNEILGVDQATAEQDACRIEHVISGETLDRICMAMTEQES